MVTSKVKGAFFHIAKRDPASIKWYFSVLVRAAAVFGALIISGVLIMVLAKENPINVYSEMIEGVFGTERRIWNTLQELAILLCISLAVTPAFKMRFWNIGAEGQVLIGGLATVSVMYFLGDKLPYPALLFIMLIASIIAGIIWAVIPAIFKAIWNTNETLFTLMMNYVAIQIVAWFLKYFVKSGSGVLETMPDFGLPIIAEKKYLLNIIIVSLITVISFIYLKYSKQGYEISVVGESENTAKYIGINVKKVIIRTLVVSGALCGIAGLLIVGGTDHTISTTTVGGRGFTAIIVSWLAKFNPIIMVLTTFIVVFLDRGAQQITTAFGVPSAISDIITGIMLLSIIGCEFFLNYRIVFTHSAKEVKQ